VYNKRTKTVEESIHGQFDETNSFLKKIDDEIEDLSRQLKDGEISPNFTPEDKDDHNQSTEVNEEGDDSLPKDWEFMNAVRSHHPGSELWYCPLWVPIDW
ncbi:hypothetical protein ACLOJK_022553, partial [Asimina triloba]